MDSELATFGALDSARYHVSIRPAEHLRVRVHDGTCHSSFPPPCFTTRSTPSRSGLDFYPSYVNKPQTSRSDATPIIF